MSDEGGPPGVQDRHRHPQHPIRIPDDLWKAAQEKARLNDESVARVVRRALRQYVDGEWTDRRE